MSTRHPAISGARAALLALVLLITLAAPGARPAAGQAVNPPLLTGKLTYTFSGRADAEHSHHHQDDQVIVYVRLRWDEEADSYQDAGSTYIYTGSYSRRQFDTEDLFGMIMEGTGTGGGQVGEHIGAHVIDDEGPVRLLALSVDRLPYRTTGTVTMLPQRVVDTRGAAFSVLAGTGTPYACNPFQGTSSDGVVLVTSAHHSYGDVGLTESNHIQMTGSRADFLAWVRPHLVGPVAAAPRLTAPLLGEAEAGAGDPQVAQVLSVTLAPGESRDLALPVRDGRRLTVLLRAAPRVAASLRDPAGAEAGASPAGGPAQELRAIGVESPAPGAWTLRLSSQEQTPATVSVQVQLAETELRADAQLTGSGQAQGARLTLARGGAPATGATACARVLRADGTIAEVALVDDGQHDDGAAADGVYGAAPGALGGSSLALVAHAAIGGEERFALAVAPDGGASRIYLPLLRR